MLDDITSWDWMSPRVDARIEFTKRPELYGHLFWKSSDIYDQYYRALESDSGRYSGTICTCIGSWRSGGADKISSPNIRKLIWGCAVREFGLTIRAIWTRLCLRKGLEYLPVTKVFATRIRYRCCLMLHILSEVWKLNILGIDRTRLEGIYLYLYQENAVTFEATQTQCDQYNVSVL